ncbi:MAG TPA: prolyl oligopeptidase family serine peptidase, partial [Longimicrobiales bacterium]|nr:prolyl oligopeptidase family serine peptidase [Longimicrobiales bacterium]
MSHPSMAVPRIPRWRLWALPLGLAFALLTLASSVSAQQQGRRVVVMDSARAQLLYVSDEWEDHPARDYERDVERKARTDSIYEAVTRGVVDYSKISYRSRIDGMEIPAYVFQPMEKRGPRGHAAMVWVHGGVHGNWGATMWPFVREAVERGYVIICPEYRGSTGYGEEHHRAIDYGGYEVDDVIQGYEWLTANLPHVDPERVGIM